MVDLDPVILGRRPDELSGGQQQRIALARALARRPRLMLLDEPFSALDTGLRAITRQAVARVLRAARITTILVTHDQNEALSFADQVAVLSEGRLLQVGPPRDLYLRPRTPMVAEFIGEAIVLSARLSAGFADCALGRVPVDDCERRGAARIVLRPEQVKFVQVEEQGPRHASADYLGKVVEVDFGGSVCSVRVRLLKATGEVDADSPPLRLIAASTETPQLGAIVRITVVGKAHVFPLDERS